MSESVYGNRDLTGSQGDNVKERQRGRQMDGHTERQIYG